MDISEIRDTLRSNIVVLSFKKKDGSIREMVATTMDEYIPPVSGNSVPNDSLVTVWDLENEGWRSFRFDSLIDFYVERSASSNIAV